MAERPRFPIALPHIHFMALAPLDAWAQLLLRPVARVPARYWLRLAFALVTSAIGTALTLPERLVLGPYLWWQARRGGAKLAHEPGAVVILGYYRSGTTHLHYLLSCDPQFRTPRWCEALAPQGFYLSWLFLRIFMIPFMSAKRPQDDVAIGPEWPAEDDFALCNWGAASSLPGRFIVPQLHGHYSRFHTLEGLAAGDRWRWRRMQWAFCWKLSSLARKRKLLLKTPSHTARVRELVDLFGPGRVKFIHIRRDADEVITSNLRMHGRLHIYNLQDPPETAEVERRIVEEYAQTEALHKEHSRELSPGDFVEIRYEDLVNDPLGETRRAYGQLGLEWTARFEKRAQSYLESVRDYRAANGQRAMSSQAATAGEHASRGRPLLAIAATALVALALVFLWAAQAFIFRERNDGIVWLAGIVLGLVMIRVARVGSAALGIAAAAMTALLFAAAMVAVSIVIDFFPWPNYRGLPINEWHWGHIMKQTRENGLRKSNIFWILMGTVTAYRFASRKNVTPPGS